MRPERNESPQAGQLALHFPRREQMKTARTISCLTLLCISMAVQVSAQVNTASLTGLVTDSAGAVVPNASVSVKNKATDVESSATTDSSGYYTFASLPVGTYPLTIELSGFKKAIHENIILEVGQKARVDTTLEVGSVTESVVVATAPPLLTTQEAATGAVVDNRAITDLPLSARNWDDLLGGIAGVQGDRYTEEGGATSAGRTGGVNV